MDQKRNNIYIYVTWLTKLLAGENQCKWATWYKAHYQYSKIPPKDPLSLAEWTREHNILLQQRKEKYEKEKYRVTIEDQNAFKYIVKVPKHDTCIDTYKNLTLKKECDLCEEVIIAGKADLIAIKEITRIDQQRPIYIRCLIEDEKTGKQRNSDIFQMMIYLLAFDKKFEIEKKFVDSINGILNYKNGSIIEVPFAKITESFKNDFNNLVKEINSNNEPFKVPSKFECQWCDIQNCEKRIY